MMVGAAHRLPIELVEVIVKLAADEDWKTAHALAFVSRDVCRWTEEQRWKTVIITSWRQSVALWRTICKVPDVVAQPYFDLAHYAATGQIEQSPNSGQAGGVPVEDLEDDERDERSSRRSRLRDEREFTRDERILRRRIASARFSFDKDVLTYQHEVKPISYSVQTPHRYTENLFFETDPAHDVFYRWLEPWSPEHISDYGESTREFLPQEPVGPWTARSNSDKARHEVPRIVSLGASNTRSAFNAILRFDWQESVPEELTIVLDEKSAAELPTQFPASLLRTKRIHVVGVHSQSEVAGVEPPWTLFDSFARPTPRLERQITHLRYDTRRFSFKPAEITAHRMKMFFQEPALVPLPRPSSEPSDDSPIAQFQHQGPRHAAPVRGAGNIRNLQHAQSRLMPVQRQAEDELCPSNTRGLASAMANESHVGAMQLLHFAWAPSSSPDAKSSNQPPAEETGGWPREVRGAWTERSEKADQHEAFAAELRDAVATLYGWDAPDIVSAHRYCARRLELPSRLLQLANGANPVTTQSTSSNTAFVPVGAGMMVREHPRDALSISELAKYDRWVKGLPQFEAHFRAFREAAALAGEVFDADQHFVQYGYRAPRSLLHLGGPAALRREDRLHLFLDRARGGRGAWP